MSATAPASTTIRLHRLTMVTEDDGVMVGRPDIGSYALFPQEGAEALRLLDAGTPMAGVAAWYQQTCGASLDVDDFVAALDDLKFLRGDAEDEPREAPVRWQRLGRWTFSWPALACYAALTLAAVVAMARAPYLRPTYHHIFFTQYLSLIPITPRRRGAGPGDPAARVIPRAGGPQARPAVDPHHRPAVLLPGRRDSP